MTTKAYAAWSAESPLAPFSISRREPLPTDVQIDILYKRSTRTTGACSRET
jgi:uncharacterized zinc-type alcohol dehydrogenase-like protein